MTSAEDLIEELGLSSHPEGGWYRETWRAEAPEGSRSAGTAIYYLLKEGEASHWHRVTDGDELWFWHAGDPLILSIAEPDGHKDPERHVLGPDITIGQTPQVLIPVNHWQAARPDGRFALVSCTVTPAFEFTSFEMAPPDWHPGTGNPGRPDD